MSSPFEIQPIARAADFAALRDEWRDLADRSDVTLFQTWEWMHAWWRHLGHGRLRILALREGHRLVGLAPLFIQRYGPLRRLLFLGTGASDYLQFIVDERLKEEGHRALLDYVAAHPGGWDFCDWQQIPANSLLATMAAPPGVRNDRFVQEICPYLPLPESRDSFRSGLGKKLRSNLGYYQRLLERDFELEWRVASNGDTGAGMRELFRLHQRRWNRRGLPGAFAGSRSRAFHLDVAAALQQRGWLRLHLLRVNGQEKAALYCFSYRDRGYYYLGGFTPEMRRYSLGTMLTARAIETAIEEGATEFDFLRGDEPYKYMWRASSRHNWRWLWWRPSGLSALAPALNRLERVAERKIKEFARSRR